MPTPGSHWGVLSAFVRFVGFTPMGIYAGSVAGHAKSMAKYPQLRHPPYHASIIPSAKFVHVVGVSCIVWSCVIWLPTAVASAHLDTLFMLGVVDLILTICMFVSLCLEGTYIPPWPSQCSKAASWQVPSNTSSLFQLTAGPGANATTVIGECQDYRFEWFFGWGSFVLWALIAWINIWVSQRKRTDRITMATIATLLFGIIRCFGSILLWLGRPPFEFIRRISAKWCERRKYDEVVNSLHNAPSEKGKDIQTTPPPGVAFHHNKDEKSETVVTAQEISFFAELPYDILLSICQDLHYKDVVNLGLTSKTMQETLFGNGPDKPERAEMMRFYSCDASTKLVCWACGVQICHECQNETRCRDPPALVHWQCCRVACTSCYYTSLWKAGGKKCACFDRKSDDAHEEVGRRGWWGERRSVCWSCVGRDADSLQRLAIARDRLTLRRLDANPRNCGICSKGLAQKGPRWWVCSQCNRECTSKLHPPWARTSNSESESGIGEV